MNSIAHQFGTRPYETNDNSRNSLFLAVIMLGEGFHNNHHRFPNSARFALQRKQLDLGYGILVVLEKLGLIRDMKIAGPERGLNNLMKRALVRVPVAAPQR